ncbi:LacI family DNA-binding transcriptional regulator [Lichenibacterium dinghuense]|uniref:LacI family DNA-binding transcriptional regulator n=1 Tax=Lichenibacterium dinghuense TaxID=2895977 RepID=UPI001F241E92|nr:LacI family DNA-binding transcriptional regulator [Lichenibacterium sp. 6Y81]
MDDHADGGPSPPRRHWTMEEFAEAAGVSRPTVSKYFNDPDSVRPASRQRIRDAMREFGYQPNLFAVNFNRRSTKTIGIVVPSLTDPFYAEVVRWVELGALGAGYWSIVLSSHADPALEVRALQVLDSIKVAGVLIAPLGNGAPPRHRETRAPTVYLDSRMDGDGCFVGTDNARSFEQMVEYLCRTGEPPCFVAMPEVNRNAQERRDAFTAAMGRRGLAPVVLEPARHGWAFEEIGHETATRAIDAGGFPSRTVLCANDRLAFGAMAAATERGLRVGRAPGCDLRLAGHDDHPLSRFTCPSLTTMAQDYAGIARAGLSSLLAQALPGTERRPDRVQLLDAKLMMRDSA